MFLLRPRASPGAGPRARPGAGAGARARSIHCASVIVLLLVSQMPLGVYAVEELRVRC